MQDNGFKIAKNITKQYAKTFYFASKFLAEDKRNAAHAVYAICRLSDESVDNGKSTSSLQSLTALKQDIEAAYASTNLNSPLLAAFRQTINKYRIPQTYFNELISGMLMDLEKTRYANFNELYDYCYKAAGVVGLIMLEIFGFTEKSAKTYAVELGVAMQLTNILRDIKEDYRRGRIYLPLDEMRQFGISEADLAHEKITDNFKDFMKFQINKARKYYQNSNAGISLIADKNSKRVVTLMTLMYSGILSSIENNNYDCFIKRAHVNNIKKISIALNVFIKNKNNEN